MGKGKRCSNLPLYYMCMYGGCIYIPPCLHSGLALWQFDQFGQTVKDPQWNSERNVDR